MGFKGLRIGSNKGIEGQRAIEQVKLWSMGDVDEYRCFMGSLSWSTTDRDLRDAFEKLGHLVEAKINGAIVISASPGLKDVMARKILVAIGESGARSRPLFGLRALLNTWYNGDMWQSFREHPNFKKIVTRRLQHDDVHGLAKAVSDLSI